MIRQELNPVTCKLDRKQINLRRSLRRYKWLIRPLIHRNAIASLDWIGKSAPVPLHYLRREKKEEKRKRRKFYIYPDVTHTPGRAGETLKGKRKKKADTLDSTATTLIIQEHNCCIYQQAKTCIYCNARLNVCNRDTASSHFEAR